MAVPAVIVVVDGQVIITPLTGASAFTLPLEQVRFEFTDQVAYDANQFEEDGTTPSAAYANYGVTFSENSRLRVINLKHSNCPIFDFNYKIEQLDANAIYLTNMPDDSITEYWAALQATF